MSRTTRHFLALLGVELEDVAADLREVEEVMRDRLKRHTMTPYVFQQNAALLESEIEGIRRICLLIRDYPFEPDADLPETVKNARAVIRGEIQRLQLPHALASLLERRIQKLLEYVDCCT